MLEMAKEDQADSDPEESSETSTPEEAGAATNGGNNRRAAEYEKQRLYRIAENRKRMEALGLSKMASAVMGSGQNAGKVKQKGKSIADMKVKDVDYQPDEGEEMVDSSGEEDESSDYDDEDFASLKDSRSRREKAKKKAVSTKKKASVQKHLPRLDFVDDDDALKQAIALSLRDSAEVSDAKMPELSGVEKKNNAKTPDDKGKKRKNQFVSRMKMSEDELVVNFYQFDGDWKGGITAEDVRRMAVAHDFTWSDRELSDMISCFDGDRDGKLSLEEFREIVGRCNMIKQPETG